MFHVDLNLTTFYSLKKVATRLNHSVEQVSKQAAAPDKWAKLVRSIETGEKKKIELIWWLLAPVWEPKKI